MIRTRLPQGQPAVSKRLPLLLVAALLLAMVAVSGFTVALLQGQRAVFDEAIRRSESESIVLLAHRIEQATVSVVRAPFRVLKNIPINDGHLTQRLMWMHQQFPEVEHVLFLDENLHPLESQPPSERSKGNATSATWLLQQLREESLDTDLTQQNMHSLVETIAGHSTLLVWQPLDDADPQKGWLAIAFDLTAMRRAHIEPLLGQFRQTQAGTIRLQDAESAWAKDALIWPIGAVLPGWQLVFESDPQAISRRLDHARLVTVGMASAVLLALLLATIVVWREIHRERTLLELRNRFVASVSHELKSPLTLIRMYAETLYLGRLSDEQRRQQYYRTILRESERLTHMIDNVLDFARVSKGLPTYHLTQTNIGQTVAQVLDDYQPHVSERGVQLKVHLQPELPPVLHDPHGVTQILLNLIDNAVKYGADGKIVTVELDQTETRVRLKVRDRGQGITAQTATETNPIRGKSNGTRSNTQGMGLGLALVSQIAHAHGASFNLLSKHDHPGTEAVVSFPIADAAV